MTKYALEAMMAPITTSHAWEDALSMVGKTVHITCSAPLEALELAENGTDSFEVEDCGTVEGIVCLFLRGLDVPVALSAVSAGDDEEGGEWQW